MKYTGGQLGISAVPGSGKTWILSRLASEIIRSGVLADDQEILIVTLVNSAVDNFYQRISAFIRMNNLIPNMGYRVRTLHGLAHDIVRERPGLVGLDEKFQIIDDRAAEAIRKDVARAWLKNHPEFFDQYLAIEPDDSHYARVKRDDIPSLVESMATSMIRSAKDYQLTPEGLRSRLDHLPMPLAEMGWEMYSDYQQALAYRGAVDFDDLIRLAFSALTLEERYLERLRYQWPFILEDEAQDSSRLQEQILETLTGEQGNWVRVGDPNQAIFETFTTADPDLLRFFLQREDVTSRDLPESGRSTKSIINLANHLVDWVKDEHPIIEARSALQQPYIKPTRKTDPQPNPPDDPSQVFLVSRKFSPQEEVRAVADSLEKWLPEHQHVTVAVLAPRNSRAIELANELNRRGIEYDDSLLQSSSSTRRTAGSLGAYLAYLAEPQSPRKLAKVYQVWMDISSETSPAPAWIAQGVELLRKHPHSEDFTWPAPGRDWLADLAENKADADLHSSLAEFRNRIRFWQAATLLPVDQLTLTIAQDIFTETAELALAYKLALLLKSANQSNPAWRLPELTKELNVIAQNERRFLGFSPDDVGFNPEKYRGKVVLSTMHKAKGLEWDRVYLMSVNNYDFPSGIVGDKYMPEKWFIKGSLNLEAEALGQLDLLMADDPYSGYEEGEATRTARIDYVKERLRLLYVGITRAKSELIITWNTGKSGDMQEAQPLLELRNYWNEQHPDR